MNPEMYYCESPQKRKIRIHEEDKIKNPDRHNPQKLFYSREESLEWCPWCLAGINNYEYSARDNGFYRKSEINNEQPIITA